MDIKSKINHGARVAALGLAGLVSIAGMGSGVNCVNDTPPAQWPAHSRRSLDSFTVCNRYESQQGFDINGIVGEKATFFSGEDITFIVFSPYRGSACIRVRSYATGKERRGGIRDIQIGETMWDTYNTRLLREELGGGMFQASMIVNGQIMRSKDFVIKD